MKNQVIPSYWELNSITVPTFRFRVITTEEIGTEKLQCAQNIADILSQNININNYSNEVTAIVCFLTIITQDNLLHEPYKQYLTKEKKIKWKLKLDYEQVLKANITAVITIMATAYLEAITTYFQHSKLDFDSKRFYEDVKVLFQQKGWITD